MNYYIPSFKFFSAEILVRRDVLYSLLHKIFSALVAWVLGGRDTATFQRLYNKVKHLTHCTFYTDNWDVFTKVLPSERHVIGKAHTHTIERDNSNTRHHLGRFTRKTKIVSKSKVMVDITLKLWAALTSTQTFYAFQRIALSIFE